MLMRRLIFKIVYANMDLPRQHRWEKLTYIQVQLRQYYERLLLPLKKKRKNMKHIEIIKKNDSRRSRKSEYTNNHEGIGSIV